MDTFFIFSIFILIIIATIISFVMSLFLKKITKRYVKVSKHIPASENMSEEFENIYEDLYSAHIDTLESLRKPLKIIETLESLAFLMITFRVHRNYVQC